ncbi:MAG: hypothetical protein JXR37_02945 [Kiritimatiellae bacterium]|nr:hypothetical protein [Kiritimatiellia bacterium]
MKKLLGLSVLVAAITMGFMFGCEDWEKGQDDWNSSGIPADYFSGVYSAPNGEDAIVLNYNTNDIVKTHSWTDTVGVGDGSKFLFVATMTHRPILPGTVVVTDGTTVFTENDTNPGTLEASGGKSGTIDYKTGDLSLDYVNAAGAPAAGATIQATYEYETYTGSSASTIYSFVVFQEGNHLQFRDNLGNLYTGSIGSVEVLDQTTTVGPWSAIAQFSVAGTYSGRSVQIVGTLEGEVDDDASPHIVYRRMYGTWIEDNATGNVVAVAPAITYYPVAAQ